MTATGEWTEAEKIFFFFLLSSSALGIAPGLCCHMTSSLFTQPSRSNSHFVFGRSFRGCAAERPWWRRGWLVMTSPSLRARRLAVKGTWRGVSGRGGPDYARLFSARLISITIWACSSSSFANSSLRSSAFMIRLRTMSSSAGVGVLHM
uniref:Putative secreted protein n=1 Tax=Ixodes ricinus TaxID=34613 RepID=A0A6B0UUR4_IXORI